MTGDQSELRVTEHIKYDVIIRHILRHILRPERTMACRQRLFPPHSKALRADLYYEVYYGVQSHNSF